MKQAAINVPPPKADSRSLHQVLVDVLREFGPRKQEHLAAQLSQATGKPVSKGHLSEVIDGESGKHWPQSWVDHIVEQYDFRGEVAQHYAHLRGMEVRPPRQRPVAERFRRIAFILGKHNGIGKALMEEAEALPDDVFAEDEAP